MFIFKTFEFDMFADIHITSGESIGWVSFDNILGKV
jgi:hypothetical protein